jgi:hypothetical protein
MLGLTEENHDKAGQPISRPRFEHNISWNTECYRYANLLDQIVYEGG